MNPIATYSFLPWLRQGIANTITAADGDASVKTRASINVALQLSGDPVGGGAELVQAVARDIALYGPGDIVGIDANSVFRTDPHPWITNYEPNYLAAVEFYDEDFPWRYTPAAPDATGLKLRPWIALVVLQESEFTDGKNTLDRPLPFITAPDASAFPLADDLWAWSHVHINESLAASASELVSPNMGAVLPRVQAILAGNRDRAYARLICPRRLGENSGYHAFVVPTFETGRLAGLGHDPAGAPHATFSAWGRYSGQLEPTNMPVYFRWYFRTGSKGDFEYLVSLLKPQLIDTRVGTRDMDVQDPGSNIPGITDAGLGGVLRLGGALRVPDADLSPQDLALRQKYENWDQPYPHPFQKALASFINLADDYAARAAAAANSASGLGPGISDDPDPLITAPLYGRWHSLVQRLLRNRDGTPAPNATNWVHELNLDPRFRVAAGFGVEVVETNAEDYMNDAWQQIGEVLAANQRIRQLHLAIDVSTRWFEQHLTPLVSANAERAFVLAAPVAGRVVVGNSTIAHSQSASLLPTAVTSTAMRRVLRPGARLMRSLPVDTSPGPGNLLARINSGAVSPAPPKAVPRGLPTVDQAAGAPPPTGVPLWSLIVQSLHEDNQVPSSVDKLPQNPTFVLSDPGSRLRPPPGTGDSPTAANFKNALRDWYALRVAAGTAAQRPQPKALDLPGMTSAVVAGLNPQVTIPRRGLSFITIPPWILELIGEEFNEVMAYPKIDLPMYVPLKKISIELFLPNINLIAPNSVTLIETNQRFIESYMVGLNHEFARKLLWRGFPTDLRGSYFRQFWNVGSNIDSEGLSHDALKEKLYDIPELHRWALTSHLGDHNNRATGGETGEEAVLVIRGELLKKYPTAVIFAQHAKWALKAGKIDPTQPRSLDELTPAEELQPPRSKIRGPLYEAKADPDIYFFGFDLTVPEAKGQSGQNPGDDPGWFFVIKERPGEPRFGLEISRSGAIKIFDQITWDDALPGGGPGKFLLAGSLAHVTLTQPASTDPEFVQNQDDQAVDGAAVSSARWAYLLFRAPVMVAVHADEMLR
jgi:hypothetical protein